jgi:cytoskeletal protein CcmA (bactofilin family)
MRGAARVVAAAEVGFADLHGSTTIGRDLLAADLRSKGSLEVGGSCRVSGRLRLGGSGRFDGPLRAAELDSSGRLDVGGDLEVEGAARIRGRAAVRGGLSAGPLELDGELIVTGTITARSLTGFLEGASRTGAIRADTVDLRRRSPRLPPWKPAGTLHTLRIEAHEARLEGVTVEFLRADQIDLGPECRVARWEGTLRSTHRSARLGPSSISVPPPGLNR